MERRMEHTNFKMKTHKEHGEQQNCMRCSGDSLMLESTENKERGN